ncbi:MAG: alcohol dehydrogenase catalytic domain-containing protein [Thaumarchaeota archaeon]|nr:alcohol dehydrogenase catalytic domain-containing protein [Nitrososphaerota archaeon]
MPILQAGEVLMEMKACGLCGTDIEKMHGQYAASLPIIGHEAVGVVAEIADKIEGLRLGDRVFPHHHVPCYGCYFCRHGSETMCSHYRATNLDPGGFSEYFRVPAWNINHGGVLKIPEPISFEEASFIEPTACCIRNLKRCQVSKGDTVLIVGAGPIGLIHLMLLKLQGADTIVTDVSSKRLRFAEKLGAQHAISPLETDVTKEVREETKGRGVDLAIVASGNPQAIVQALSSVRKGGKVCLFGVPVKGSYLNYDFSDIFNSEVSIVSSNAATETETKEALKLLEEQRFKPAPLIAKFKLSQFHKAVEAAEKQECIKPVIVP